MNREDSVEERRVAEAPAKPGRVAEALLAVCSAIAWAALMVSLWGLLQRDRARREAVPAKEANAVWPEVDAVWAGFKE